MGKGDDSPPAVLKEKNHINNSNSPNDTEKSDNFRWSQDGPEITIIFKDELESSVTEQDVKVTYPSKTSLKVVVAGNCLLHCFLSHEIETDGGKCNWKLSETNSLHVTLTKV